MDRWVGKVAVVTGASFGIGAAIAEKLVEAGLLVVGIARRDNIIEDNAKKLAGKKGKLYARKVDLTNEDEIINAYKWITDNLGPVHVVINNAAALPFTRLTDGDTEAWRLVMETNVLAVAVSSREACKIMKAHNVDGHIININSVVGHKAVYFAQTGLYSPAKFALRCYTDILSQELLSEGSKIKVSSISPGVVKTEMGHDSELAKTMVMPMLHTSAVANAVVYVLGTPPDVQVQELVIKPMGETF